MRIKFHTPFYAPPDQSRFTSRRVAFGRINDAALSCSQRVVSAFLPQGRLFGAEWVSANPTRTDKRPGSFKVNVKTGKWADWSSGDRGGDLVSLVAYVCALTQRDAAIQLAEAISVDPFE